jgi:hypothetical protein
LQAAGTIVSKDGVVYLRDLSSNQDMVALTATEAVWLSFLLQHHLTSELIIQLRLAATHANAGLNDPHGGIAKEFKLIRS